ncbi:MAG: hypothetical protein Q8911_17090, partial [Bacillota bacterium]|nr:hypothetical protein [Bacillota bacterium]
MRQGKISTLLQNYLGRYFYRPPLLFHSLFEERRFSELVCPKIPDGLRQLLAGKLNPFNLCPRSVTFWYVVPPYNAVGVTVAGFNKVVVYWRQLVEPNETAYLAFKLLNLRTPFPLTLLVFFTSLGLLIGGTTYGIYQTVNALSTENAQKTEDTVEGVPAAV